MPKCSIFVTIIMPFIAIRHLVFAEFICNDNLDCKPMSDMKSFIKLERDDNACSIYLFPSSVPGSGMGIFSIKDFRKGDVILSSDGPTIPIIDPYFKPNSKSHWALFESYWWVRKIQKISLYLFIVLLIS